MKIIKLFSGLLGLALGLGLTVSTSPAQAVVVKGEYTFTEVLSGYLDVLGEGVQETATYTAKFHVVTTPSGNVVNPDMWRCTSSVLVTDSGTSWIMVRYVSPAVFSTTGNGSMVHWVSRKTYVNHLGQRLEARFLYHMTFDADGNPKIQREVYRFQLKD